MASTGVASIVPACLTAAIAVWTVLTVNNPTRKRLLDEIALLKAVSTSDERRALQELIDRDLSRYVHRRCNRLWRVPVLVVASLVPPLCAVALAVLTYTSDVGTWAGYLSWGLDAVAIVAAIWLKRTMDGIPARPTRSKRPRPGSGQAAEFSNSADAQVALLPER